MPSTTTDRLNGLTTSVARKAPCRVATTASITLSGLQDIDGVTVDANDRVLVKNQTNAVENGIYLAQTGNWTRAPDFNGSLDVRKGTDVFIHSGSTQSGAYWHVTTADDIVVGTSEITWVDWSSQAEAAAAAAALSESNAASDAATVAAQTTLAEAAAIVSTTASAAAIAAVAGEDAAIALLEKSSLVTPAWPVTPAIEIQATDLYDGRYIGSRGSESPRGNILFFNSGEYVAQTTFSGTYTPRDEAGHSTGLAFRLQFTSSSHTFSLMQADMLEAGTWTLSLRVKSKAGGGSQAMRFGDSTALASATVTEASFSLLSVDLTVDGSTNKTLRLTGDGSNTPDVLVDEVWLSLDGAAPVPFPFAAGAAARAVTIQGEWEAADNTITNITRGARIHGPDWPAISSPEGLTVFTAFRCPVTPTSNQYLYAGVTDAVVGSNSADASLLIKNSGEIQTNPRSVFSSGVLVDDGRWHIIAQRSGSTERCTMVDGVPQIVTAGTFTFNDLARMDLLALNEASSKFQGDFAQFVLFDSALSDADLATSHGRVASILELRGNSYNRGEPVLIFEGDSRVAQNFSFGWKMLNDKTYTDAIQQTGGILATSAHGIADIADPDSAQNLKDVKLAIANALAMGRVPVVTVLIGTNDNAAVIADPTAYFNDELVPYWTEIKNAGGRLVACTELPRGAASLGGTGSDWEVARAILNPLILASSIPDAIADIGDTATVMGDPDSPDDTPVNWTDDVHPNTTGHGLLTPVVWAAIKVAAA